MHRPFDDFAHEVCGEIRESPLTGDGSEQRLEEVKHVAVLKLRGLARLLNIATFPDPVRRRDPSQTFREGSNDYQNLPRNFLKVVSRTSRSVPIRAGRLDLAVLRAPSNGKNRK